MSTQQQDLIDLIGCLRASSAMPQHKRAAVYRNNGIDALRNAIFEQELSDSEFAAARTQATTDIALWQAKGYRITPIDHPEYPQQLMGLAHPPTLLFTQGSLLADDPAVSIIGTPNATEQYRNAAAEITTSLVRAGITIVSGFSPGIAATAHHTALTLGGRTTAITATGLDHTHPNNQQTLRDRIAEHGLFCSQFFPPQNIAEHTLAMRNVVMAGYSQATIIIAGGEHSPAKLIARATHELGRTLILTPSVARTTWGKNLVAKQHAVVAQNPQQAVQTALLPFGTATPKHS